jgi:hypothetical protein
MRKIKAVFFSQSCAVVFVLVPKHESVVSQWQGRMQAMVIGGSSPYPNIYFSFNNSGRLITKLQNPNNETVLG